MSLLSFAEKACPPFCRPMLDRVKNSPIGRRIVGNSFWSIAGSGAAKAFTLLALILTARILGKELNGEFGFIRSTAMSFVTFSCFGIGVTATKHIAESFQTDRERTGRIIGLGYGFSTLSAFVIAAVFYGAVPWLCEKTMNAPHLVFDMRLGAVLLFLLTFMTAQTGVMMGFHDFRGMAVTNGIAGLLAVPFYAGGAYYGGLRGALSGLLIVSLINVLSNSVFIFRNTRKYQIRYSFRDAYKEAPLLWQYGLPTLLCAGSISVSNWLSQLFLAMQPDGNSELGIYYIAMILYPVIIFIPEQVAAVFLPLLSEINASKDKSRYQFIVIKFFIFSIFTTMIFAFLTSFYAEQILGLCGEEYKSGYWTVLAICISAIVFMMIHTANIVVISLGRMRLYMAFHIIGAASTIFFSFWFTSHGFGSFGLAMAFLSGLIIKLLVIGLAQVKRFNSHRFFKNKFTF